MPRRASASAARFRSLPTKHALGRLEQRAQRLERARLAAPPRSGTSAASLAEPASASAISSPRIASSGSSTTSSASDWRGRERAGERGELGGIARRRAWRPAGAVAGRRRRAPRRGRAELVEQALELELAKQLARARQRRARAAPSPPDRTRPAGPRAGARARARAAPSRRRRAAPRARASARSRRDSRAARRASRARAGAAPRPSRRCPSRRECCPRCRRSARAGRASAPAARRSAPRPPSGVKRRSRMVSTSVTCSETSCIRSLSVDAISTVDAGALGRARERRDHVVRLLALVLERGQPVARRRSAGSRETARAAPRATRRAWPCTRGTSPCAASGRARPRPRRRSRAGSRAGASAAWW